MYEARQLDDVNEAFEEVEQARARARLVFDIGGVAHTAAVATAPGAASGLGR